MTARFRREPGSPHRRSAWVAVLVLLCQATAWVHASATPHVTCVEHGESVHLALGTPSLPDARGPALASPPADTTAHAHEHCSLQGQRTTSAPSPSPSFVAGVLASIAAPVVSLVPAPVRLLSLAPKTSPPRTPAV